MNIQITAKKIDIAQDIRDAIKEKLSRLDRFNPKTQSLEAVIKAEERGVSCELILRVENHDSRVVAVSGETVQAAVDIAVGKAERQLRKGKERDSVRRRAKPQGE
jgi:ribosomal subunit interface protein